MARKNQADQAVKDRAICLAKREGLQAVTIARRLGVSARAVQEWLRQERKTQNKESG